MAGANGAGSRIPVNPNATRTFDKDSLKDIYLAGGCFWGVEAFMARIPGVAETTVGYANGITENPTYEEVCRGNTKHAETVQVVYDPAQVSLETLLDAFFTIIDPVSKNRQGNDIGTQYRTGIYTTDPADAATVQEIFEAEQKKYNRPLAVELKPLLNFYPAEDYHQDYLDKNPNGYCHVDFGHLDDFIGSGEASKDNKSADVRVDPDKYAVPSEAELNARLTPQQLNVARKGGTEAPFDNAYWDNKEPGLYVDIVTGEPLFTSLDKYDSGSGWPSFTQPVDSSVVKENLDISHGMTRQEVRSRVGDTHLGHVFPDGPKNQGGLRYCLNSASLRFIPVADLEKEGYGEFLPLFETGK